MKVPATFPVARLQQQRDSALDMRSALANKLDGTIPYVNVIGLRSPAFRRWSRGSARYSPQSTRARSAGGPRTRVQANVRDDAGC